MSTFINITLTEKKDNETKLTYKAPLITTNYIDFENCLASSSVEIKVIGTVEDVPNVQGWDENSGWSGYSSRLEL